jgi:hypothetical protein
MKKLTFEQVLAEDRRLWSRITDDTDIPSYMDRFNDFLKEAGWTSEEYDDELVKMIDPSWDGKDKWDSN